MLRPLSELVLLQLSLDSKHCLYTLLSHMMQLKMKRKINNIKSRENCNLYINKLSALKHKSKWF